MSKPIKDGLETPLLGLVLVLMLGTQVPMFGCLMPRSRSIKAELEILMPIPNSLNLFFL